MNLCGAHVFQTRESCLVCLARELTENLESATGAAHCPAWPSDGPLRQCGVFFPQLQFRKWSLLGRWGYVLCFPQTSPLQSWNVAADFCGGVACTVIVLCANLRVDCTFFCLRGSTGPWHQAGSEPSSSSSVSSSRNPDSRETSVPPWAGTCVCGRRSRRQEAALAGVGGAHAWSGCVGPVTERKTAHSL